jgi:type II secretory pathway pseudopilin PulG
VNRKQHVKDVGAFTLIEVMFAAAVLALGLIGMIQAVVSGSQMLDVARKQTIAAQIIHGQIDNVRLSNWTQVGALATPRTVKVDASDNGGDQSANVSAGFVFGSNLPTVSKDFTCTRTITTVRTDLKQITFTISWTGNTGRTYTRSGSTYVGKNGLYVTYQRS